jgi:predicted Zn-dependent protease
MTTQLKSLLNQLSGNADWVGLRQHNEVTSFRAARNGHLASNGTERDRGIMVEVLVDGQFAYAGTTDISTSGVQQCYERATGLAELANRHNLHKFDVSVRPAGQGGYKSEVERPLASITPAEVQESLIDITTQLKISDKIMETQASALITNLEVDFVSSNGADWRQEFSIITRDFAATAQGNGDFQKRSLGNEGRQWGAEALDVKAMADDIARVAEQAVELLDADECPSGSFDTLLMPDQLYLQVHESVGHPLELDRILGDERNYAGWSFISPEDFGALQYGSPLLNISFDPGLANEMATYRFDDAGVAAEKHYLIKNGLLVRGIGGIESQHRSDLPGVSCSRACSWNRPPIDRMGNINIEPGDSSLDDMIAAMERGIIMHTNRSWSIDDYRNKFQFGCEYAQLVENGKVTKTLKNPNYRGVTTPFWNKLAMVGDLSSRQIWGSPYCGKGEPNQAIRVGHAVPACLFRGLDVFGGA